MKAWKKLFVTTVAIGGAVAVATPAQAAIVSSGTTGTGVGFTGTNIVVPPAGQDLELNFVPRSFAFGNAHSTSSTSQTYTDTSGAKHYVALTDKRAAAGVTGATWKVVAKATPVANTSLSTDILAGATYSVNTATAVAPSGTSDPASYTPAPTTLAVGKASATIPTNGTSVTVLESLPTGSGDGQYGAQVQNVTLTVPTTGTAGAQYGGSVIWELDDTL